MHQSAWLCNLRFVPFIIEKINSYFALQVLSYLVGLFDTYSFALVAQCMPIAMKIFACKHMLQTHKIKLIIKK